MRGTRVCDFAYPIWNVVVIVCSYGSWYTLFGMMWVPKKSSQQSGHDSHIIPSLTTMSPSNGLQWLQPLMGSLKSKKFVKKYFLVLNYILYIEPHIL